MFTFIMLGIQNLEFQPEISFLTDSYLILNPTFLNNSTEKGVNDTKLLSLHK